MKAMKDQQLFGYMHLVNIKKKFLIKGGKKKSQTLSSSLPVRELPSFLSPT